MCQPFPEIVIQPYKKTEKYLHICILLVTFASKIVLLNAFLKKSTKDYKSQIRIAENIIKENNYEEQ